jgi:hypothetical protein
MPIVTRSSIAESQKAKKKDFFNHEEHEVNKTHLFLRALRTLRGASLAFSNAFSLSK